MGLRAAVTFLDLVHPSCGFFFNTTCSFLSFCFCFLPLSLCSPAKEYGERMKSVLRRSVFPSTSPPLFLQGAHRLGTPSLSYCAVSVLHYLLSLLFVRLFGCCCWYACGRLHPYLFLCCGFVAGSYVHVAWGGVACLCTIGCFLFPCFAWRSPFGTIFS